MGFVQKIEMSKRTPRNPKSCIYNNEYIKAKVRTTPMVKSNLLFCNMNTWLTRKVNQEKVQVNATLREGALCILQGRMY